MTLKTAVDSAAIRAVGNAPAAVFASSETIAIEMADLSNEVAKDIAESAEWRALTRISQMSGAMNFPVPVDYDRMLVGQGIQDKTTWFWGYYPFSSVSEYMLAVNGNLPLISPGGWILLENEFKFYPLPVGEATFPYISNHIVRGSDGALKKDFTADDDTFVLSERLLTLGILWRWRAQKGMDYSEDLANYETEFARLSNKDKGARVLMPDVRHSIPGARMAYANRGRW